MNREEGMGREGSFLGGAMQRQIRTLEKIGWTDDGRMIHRKDNVEKEQGDLGGGLGLCVLEQWIDG